MMDCNNGFWLALTASFAAGLVGCSQSPDTEGEQMPAQPDTAAAAPAAPAEPVFTYIKASNPGVGDQFGGGGAAWGHSLAMSRDGLTLAVGSRLEDSAATGINGDQTDNSARDSGAVYVFTRASENDPWAQQAYVKASNAEEGDQFGFNVGLSDDGNTLIVTAPEEDSSATGIDGDESDNSYSNAGAAYVFTRSNGTWTQQAYVKASNTGELEDGDTFGFRIALSSDGDTVAISALGEDSAATGINGDQSDNSAGGAGAVYVFIRNGATWSQQAYIKASNMDASDLFGSSVSLSDDGNWLAVGALDEDSNAKGLNGDQTDNSARGSGAVYVYRRDGASWSQQAYIKASNTERNDAFGVSVAFNGDATTLAVGAMDEDSTSTGVNGAEAPAEGTDWESDRSIGAVYVFTRSDTTWTQQAYLKASDPGPNDQFGVRVSLDDDGNVLAVPTPLEDGGGRGIDPVEDDSAEDAGVVYLFRRSGETWRQAAYIKAPNADTYDEFGATAALSGDGSILAIGSRGEDGGGAGVGADQSDNSVRDAGAVYVLDHTP
jgi:hypothetical protein